jgi:transcriptional pleiotropic regulator of transition state genes
MKVRTGLVRETDAVGRLTLPSEMRHLYDIKPGDIIEFFIDGDKLILSKKEYGCLFCGGRDGLTVFKGRHVCKGCLTIAADEVKGKNKGGCDNGAVSVGRA